MDLSDKLAGLAREMSDAELANYKLLLGMAAGGLARSGQPPESGLESEAFSTAITAISALQPHRHRVPPNGVVYRGRPSFVTDALLRALQEESASLRHTALRFDDHYVVSGAPLAREIGFSTELNDLVSAHADHVTPTAKANYLYYDKPGMGIDPHVDNETFSLNAIMMLEHVYERDPSALILYPPRSPVERIFLSPGEMIVMYADSITHARERIRAGERVRIVAFGFQPLI
ncbi:MAG TPA: hypothetical protein VF006_18420 [Longimicrobium sp.]